MRTINSVQRGLTTSGAPPTIVTSGNLCPQATCKGETMADERQTASGSDLGKDPVFLVMVSGQIESAEVSSVTIQNYRCIIDT